MQEGGRGTKDVFNLDSYHFHLPQELIAQYPAERRDDSRLLILDRKTGKLEDRVFSDVVDYLEADDTLVLNKTRVIPARLYGSKPTGGKVEILLLRKKGSDWEALVQPARRLRKGSEIIFPGSNVIAEVIKELAVPGGRLICFKNCQDEEEFIDKAGHMPLPPYIKRAAQDLDKNRYQTIYARENGSVAAPTAGLHFTEQLLEKVKKKGVNIATVVLHVGLGTFRPVYSRDIRGHKMHSEYYKVDENTACLLSDTRKKGKSIVAVGTTVVRTLETVYDERKGFLPEEGETDKFIYPGYDFKAIDKLITNFHLPGSSLLMLVAAFAGLSSTMEAYRYAVEQRYRFFSYGDAMFIL
ncbi:MAG: tRNA preQ1(34) S-adenosylmethionine ribosyltransferase-isomerase QueA [Syntrophomonadaceae bacterium]|nr:tRNA preQ1(34) S-adenosylmethionine ribosyltransferase-isomerase QueA [Syntrophomonadaceae bacterium]